MSRSRSARTVKISTRVWALSMLFSALVVVVGGYGEWNTMKLSHSLDKITRVYLLTTTDLIKIDMFHDGLAAKTYKSLEYATQKKTDLLKETQDETEKMSNDIRDILKELKATEMAPDSKKLLDEISAPLEEYINIVTQIVRDASSFDRDTALSRMPIFEKKFEILEKALGELGTQLKADAGSYIQSALEHSDNAQKWNLMIIIFGVISGFLVSLYFVRSIFSSLSHLTQNMATDSKNLRAAAKKLSSASSSLADTTHEQSSAIEETVSSMEQMSSMISQTSQNSELTLRETRQALETLGRSKDIIVQMVASMSNIAASNEKLQSIVKVIDEISSKTKVINDIAFETKLLAFNASIEAARAGAHGRGFSVVAEEVGNLAKVSGTAAEEVRNLLTSSLTEVESIVSETRQRVDQGQKISNDCESSFRTIETAIKGISGGIERIATATKEQDTGVKQTNLAMMEMEKITQLNSRNAEKLSEYSTELKAVASGMRNNSTDMAELVWGHSGSLEADDAQHNELDENKSAEVVALPVSVDDHSQDESLSDSQESRWHKSS